MDVQTRGRTIRVKGAHALCGLVVIAALMGAFALVRTNVPVRASAPAWENELVQASSVTEGEVCREGSWYYVNADGSYAKGWMHLSSSGGKWVYYDPTTGRMAKGERYVEGDLPGWCYFDEATGATRYGWMHLSSSGGKWVYYDPTTGRMAKGERYVEGDLPGWCYFDEATGATQYGWRTMEDGRRCFYDKSTGRMVKGTVLIDGSTYRFDQENGNLLGEERKNDSEERKNDDKSVGGSNIWDDDAYVKKMIGHARSIGSETGWFCTIDTSNCRVVVLQRSGTSWQVKLTADANLGKSSTPTFTGTRTVDHKSRAYWRDGIGINDWWTCYLPCGSESDYDGHMNPWNGMYDDGQGFHYGFDGDRPGYNSAGCTCLSMSEAKYIYDNVPVGSTVHVF